MLDLFLSQKGIDFLKKPTQDKLVEKYEISLENADPASVHLTGSVGNYRFIVPLFDNQPWKSPSNRHTGRSHEKRS